MHTNTKKSSKRKSHVSSDEEEVLKISEEEVEFLDQGAVQKPKKPSSRLRKYKLHAGNFSTFLKELIDLLTARSVERQSFVWRNWENQHN